MEVTFQLVLKLLVKNLTKDNLKRELLLNRRQKVEQILQQHYERLNNLLGVDHNLCNLLSVRKYNSV